MEKNLSSQESLSDLKRPFPMSSELSAAPSLSDSSMERNPTISGAKTLKSNPKSVSTEIPSSVVSSKPSSPSSNQTSFAISPNVSTPQTSRISTSSSFAPAPASMAASAPPKRTFASVAKQVIIQERIRKAEAEDVSDEEDGKNTASFLILVDLTLRKKRQKNISQISFLMHKGFVGTKLSTKQKPINT